MKDPVWLYRDCNDACPLHALALNVKTDLRSARARIRAISSAVVDVVYHLPWYLNHASGEGAEEMSANLSQWLDFAIDALALKQEFHTRVRLWPIDVFLQARGRKDSAALLPAASTLSAYLLEQSSPEVFEVLEGMEACAELKGRAPVLRQGRSPLSDTQLAEVQVLLGKAARLSATEGELAQSRLAFAELQGRHDGLAEAVSLGMQAQQGLQRDLDISRNEVAHLTLELDQSRRDASALKRDFESVAAQLKAALAVPRYPDLSGRVKELEGALNGSEKVKESIEKDMVRLTEQLCQVQEELERYYLDFQALRRESSLAGHAMEKAAKAMLAQATGRTE